MFWDLGASGFGSKVWVLTIRVLEVNPERDSIRAQCGRARSVLFSRNKLKSAISEIHQNRETKEASRQTKQ